MEERAIPAGTPQDGREMRGFWLMGGALLLSLLLAVLLAARPADAGTRIKVSGCNVYPKSGAVVDPIYHTDHVHYLFGNTQITDTSTGASLQAKGSGATTCKASWFTSGGWFPVFRDVSLLSKNQVAVYYRAPGDPTKVQPIPTGLGIVTYTALIRSGGDRVEMVFPDCWDQKSLNPANMVRSRNGNCPSDHPYRIPRISYLIRFNGTITNQTLVSSGATTWAPFGTEMHADYLAANQPIFNNTLIDLCLRRGVSDPACG
jgi:hypothetical protein